MLKKIIILTIIIAAPLYFAQSKKAFKYVGVKKCKMCHKKAKQGKQYKVWKNSKHAQAYKTLLSKKADKFAAEKGYKTKAAETPECLKCHVTAYNVDASLLEKGYKKEDGITCESCHGPGSAYKKRKIMKNKKIALKNGLIIHKDHKKLCVTCHNPDSPSFVARDIDEMWKQIQHPVPKKK